MQKRASTCEKLLFCGLLIALPFVGLSAQEYSGHESFENAALEKIEKQKRDRLKGWKRIAFWCSPPEKRTSKKMFDRICDRTNTNVKFLAASSNTHVRIATDDFDLGFLSAYHGMLRLEVELFSTNCDGSACAIQALVSASFPYDEAIDQAARSYPLEENKRNGPSDSPASVPRPILAIMWGPR